MPEIKIGKYGQIQEWLEDYEEVEPGHRHISHLLPLSWYPISVENAGTGQGSRKTLERD